MLGMRRRFTYEMHPRQLGCMLAVLTMAGITVSAVACALAAILFSWRIG